MTRVCITGASGFIGRTLAERWRAVGAEAVGVDRVEDPKLGVVWSGIAKARELLGWAPVVRLEEGMSRTKAWLREQGLLPG